MIPGPRRAQHAQQTSRAPDAGLHPISRPCVCWPISERLCRRRRTQGLS